MDLLDMEQRSAEWFAARKGRITASMVGAILGIDPNCTREEAMRRMVRSYQGLPSEFVGNIATQWGVTHEDEAREVFQREHVTVQPASFVVHPKIPWLGASPDGNILQYALFECKCPFGIRNDENPVFKTIEEQPHYHAQMQIQMFVTGRVRCFFWQWTPFGNKLDVVRFDQKWIDENLPKLDAFYNEFLEICEEPLGDKLNTIDTPRALQMVAEYNDLQDAIAQAEERKAELLESIVEMCGGENSVFGGKKLTKVERAGSVSYAKAIKELAPNANLEPWRGKPSSYWTLK
jgi:exodeoxyribonuclease (lambda-induced)